jgi:hypothetical protein
VSTPERLDLAKRREIRELLGEAIALYLRNFPTLFVVALAVVLPVQAIVSGVGLEELTSGYRSSNDRAELLIPTAVGYLVVAPLIAAATIHMLQRLAAGERLHPGRSIQAGLDIFAPVFLAVLLASAGIALGFVALVVPGIYLLVRWFFVAQSVVVDDGRGPEALRASWRLTQGFWWRIFAVVLLANVVAFLPASLVVMPIQALAESADRQWISLAGMILAETLTAPFVAVVSTLLFFDLKARRHAED